MGKDTGLIVSVLALACGVFLASDVVLFFMRQGEMEKRVVLEKERDTLVREKADLLRALEEAASLKNVLEVKLSEVEEKAKAVEAELDNEKKQKSDILSQLTAEKSEAKRLTNELVSLKDEKEQLAAGLEGVRDECNALKAQIYSIQQAKEIIETKLKEALEKKEIELGKIVVKPDTEGDLPAANNTAAAYTGAGPAAQAEAKGEVIVVNKKFDFVIVSIGEDNGLRPGMDLGIYKNKKLLAMLKVEKVHANMSAAKIPPEWRDADIKEGDEVVVAR